MKTPSLQVGAGRAYIREERRRFRALLLQVPCSQITIAAIANCWHDDPADRAEASDSGLGAELHRAPEGMRGKGVARVFVRVTLLRPAV